MALKISILTAVLLVAARLFGQQTLVWSDEFDYDGDPDPNKWTRMVMPKGEVNNELQRYVTDADNSFVDGGYLHVRALGNENDITSARLSTRGKGEWLYGRMEARIKVPGGLGSWPAFWMMPAKSSYGWWPSSGEIDIMEYVGYQKDIVHATVHTQAYNHVIKTQKGTTLPLEGAEDDFHIYSCVWSPEKIEIFADGTKYFEFRNDNEGNTETWPFDHPFHMILNLAIGGDWGGAEGVDFGILPCEMLVDWVRVYQ